MDSQFPNRSTLYSKKVLLVDRCQATREVRAATLRRHGIEVHTPENLAGARSLWQPQVYDLILLDVRRQLPGEALEFYEHIKGKSPQERVAFLVGSPVYLSRTWPDEVKARAGEPPQWAEAVKRFLTAA